MDAAEWINPIDMAGFTRNLICLVPIQIGRAEDGFFVPFRAGLAQPVAKGTKADVVLATISFGWYESVFAYHKGPVKVILLRFSS